MTASESASSRLRCLIVDYGGVLTNAMTDTYREWVATEGLDTEQVRSAFSTMLAADRADNPSHALERGEIDTAEFERRIATGLRRTDGGPVSSQGLLKRMLRGMRTDPRMLGLVRRAKAQGIKTALLSNSWGLGYDRAGWDALFDTVVISGEVGLRKPEPEIYLLVADRLGAKPSECVFVDDLADNVRGAVLTGMVGVHHTDIDQTIVELETLFGIDLTDDT